jgi:hypothetical protein
MREAAADSDEDAMPAEVGALRSTQPSGCAPLLVAPSLKNLTFIDAL